MNKIGCLDCSEISRRDFMRVGSLGLLGMSLGQFLADRSAFAAAGKLNRKAKAEACILFWLEGGPSHVDMWDPKPNSNFRPISTNVAGIQVSELLPKMSKHMDKMSIIRTMHTEENNHPQATYYALTGHRPNPAMQFPGFSSIIAREKGARGSVPPHVLAAMWERERQYNKMFGGAFTGPEFDPMLIPDPTKEDFQVADLRLPKSITPERIEDRRAFLNVWDRHHREREKLAEYSNMDSFRQQALNMIMSTDVREAFDLSKESDEVKDHYGRHGYGQCALLARRMVEAGSRFVTVSGNHTNGWDTHTDNDESHRDTLTPMLDQALSALVGDLHQRGLLESTVVLCMGEFGRTPTINVDLGRDHWNECWSLVIGGGGIAGGQIIGASDDQGAWPDGAEYSMGDVYATIHKAMGIDWTKTYMHPIGRPIKIANSFNDETGQPIEGLV